MGSMVMVVLLAWPGRASAGERPDARLALATRYDRVVERGRICPAEDGRPPAAAAVPAALIAALARREKEAVRDERPALPWLAAGGGALGAGAVLWAAGLERAAGLSLAGGAVASAVGILVLVRPTPRRRVRVTADPGSASVTLSVRGEL